MLKVIGIGDNVCDKYRHLGMMFPGGQALNFSVFCRNNGQEAAYLGIFGDDAVAKHIIKTLQDMKIDISHCRHYPGENGYAMVDLVNGDRVFIMSNKGGVAKEHPFDFSAEDLGYIASFDIVHTSNNSYIDAELPKLAKLPCCLSYDFSGAWKDEARTRNVCQYIDFGFMSCSDLPDTEIKNLLMQINGWGCPLAVATAGSRGAIVYDGKNFFEISPKLVKAVDTLGAGDSFAAGFLMAYMERIKKQKIAVDDPAYAREIAACLEAAAALSADTCLQIGAFGHGCPIAE